MILVLSPQFVGLDDCFLALSVDFVIVPSPAMRNCEEAAFQPLRCEETRCRCQGPVCLSQTERVVFSTPHFVGVTVDWCVSEHHTQWG
jgi:hypothetical protein